MPTPLVALVPDKDVEQTIKGLLTRWQSLRIQRISADVFVHLERDPGCLRRGHDFLQPFSKQYEHAILMFDREGCGRDQLPRERLEEETEERLSHAGWGDRAKSIVFDPEVEIWVWSDSPHVDDVLGWRDMRPGLRDWLRDRNMLQHGAMKPERPKEAMEAALRQQRNRRSSAIFSRLASVVSLERCQDQAFAKLVRTLRTWFPIKES